MNPTIQQSKFAMLVLLICSAFIHTACPGGGGGSKQPAPPPPVVVPPTVTATGGVLAQGLGRTYDDQMHLGLTFNMLTAPTQATIGNPQAYNYYSGQVAATGTLVVRSIVRPTTCPIPVGTYIVRTVTPGVWQMQSFGNLLLEAQGPVVLRIRMPSNFITQAIPPIPGADGLIYNNRIQLSMFVDTINGQPCWFSEFFLE
ncbi:MAG: hypothetical protein ABL958_18930 [Bdellovibrionia bacterium]